MPRPPSRLLPPYPPPPIGFQKLTSLLENLRWQPQQQPPPRRRSTRATTFGQHEPHQSPPPTRPRLHQHLRQALTLKTSPTGYPLWTLLRHWSTPPQHAPRPSSLPEPGPPVASLLGLEPRWLSLRGVCQTNQHRQNGPLPSEWQLVPHPGFHLSRQSLSSMQRNRSPMPRQPQRREQR